MRWIKQGLIFKPENQFDWMASHAAMPFVDQVNNQEMRIYFSTRDARGRSLPAYLEVEAENPQNILRISDKPVLELGRLGAFDDSGIMPSWIVNNGDRQFLYYIGWNPQVTTSYRLSIGLAISEDGGASFRKFSEGPIFDRGTDDPYFSTTPCVLIDNGVWRMWYTSCTQWDVVNGRPEPFYYIKHVESSDGINWSKSGTVCIDYDAFAEAICRPCVYKENGMYKMYYSYRNSVDYRIDRQTSYRLGYAESTDGLAWIRKDEEVGITRSDTGWDSEMIEYCCFYMHNKGSYLLYNGNGFGSAGFGYAVQNKA